MLTARGLDCCRGGRTVLSEVAGSLGPGGVLGGLGAVRRLPPVVEDFVIVLRGGVPTSVRLVEERHAQGDFSSDL